jgi:hypothetical protein
VKFQKFVHRLLGVEMPEHYRSLVNLKKIINMTETRDPRNFEFFHIDPDKKYINFYSHTSGAIRNVKLKSLELVNNYHSMGKEYYVFRANYKEYKEVYEKRRPIVNYIEEQVRPVYELLSSDPHPKYTMLLMEYEDSLEELLFTLTESLRVNKVIPREMEMKTIEALMGLVDSAQEIAMEFKKEEEFFTEEMNKILLSRAEDEVKFIKTSLRGVQNEQDILP